MHIQPHSQALNQGREGKPPQSFLKIEKCPDFGKKGSDGVHLWVKLSIQNLVWRVSRRKKIQNVSLRGLFFLCFSRNVYWIALVPQPRCPFAKCSILNVWQCFEYVCFDNCSVNSTMTICYVLYQTRLEFWHIQHSVFSGICQQALLRHTHAYWDIIKTYSGLFRYIQHPV